MAAYYDAVRVVVLKAVQRQDPGHHRPRNPVVASRYGMRRSIATELRRWLQAEGLLRLDGDHYVTQAPSEASKDES